MSKHFRQVDEEALIEKYGQANPSPVKRSTSYPVIDIEFLGVSTVLVRCESVMLSLKDGESFRLNHNGRVWGLEKAPTNYKMNCEK